MSISRDVHFKNRYVEELVLFLSYRGLKTTKIEGILVGMDNSEILH